jgi:large subunit ribosomal protein L32e
MLKLKKRKKHTFHRQLSQTKKRAGTRWRRPRGKDSKMRRGIRARGVVVTAGWGQPRAIRGLHPSGLREVAVHNISQVAAVDPVKEGIRLGGGVGMRKRIAIVKAADERKIRVFNRPMIKEKPKKAEAKKPEEKKPEAKK